MEDKLCDDAIIQLIAAIEDNRTDSEALRLYQEAIDNLESRMYELEADMALNNEDLEEDY